MQMNQIRYFVAMCEMMNFTCAEAQRKAYDYMGMMAVALAEGVAKQLPQKFS